MLAQAHPVVLALPMVPMALRELPHPLALALPPLPPSRWHRWHSKNYRARSARDCHQCQRAGIGSARACRPAAPGDRQCADGQCADDQANRGGGIPLDSRRGVFENEAPATNFFSQHRVNSPHRYAHARSEVLHRLCRGVCLHCRHYVPRPPHHRQRAESHA